jgi:hypothetical protein
MFFPVSYWFIDCSFNEPRQKILWEICRVRTAFISCQNIKGRSRNSSRIKFRNICFSVSFINVNLSIFGFLDKLIVWRMFTERHVSSWPISTFTCCENSMHISSSSWFFASLEWLRERVFLVTLHQHISLSIAKNRTWVHTSQSVIRMPIDNWKEVLSSSSMLKSFW